MILTSCLVFSCTRPGAELEITSVTISQPEANLVEGETLHLKAWVLPEDALDKSITWSSTRTSVASVTDGGQVTALAEGSAKIIATSVNGKTASCTIWVSKRIVDVQSISLNKTEVSLLVGKTETLIANVTPKGATYEFIIWTSTNAEVVTVSKGVVTANGSGKAVITAKVGDKAAFCNVTVMVPVTSVSLDKESITIAPGESYQLAAKVAPAAATEKSVLWSSSNPGVATVSSAGLVVGKAAGTATITVKTNDGGFTTSCVVTVSVPVASISLDKTSLTLSRGDSYALKATVSPANATDQAIVWSSSNSSVAAVSSDGVVTANSSGTATITATTASGAKSATCLVTVAVPVSSVSLDMTNLTLPVGGTRMLKATISPADATNQACTWSSDNNAVAAVTQEGVVSAKASGTAIITVTTADGNKTATCRVTVIIPVSSVSLDKTAITLTPDATCMLNAAVLPANATDKSVTWSSSDTNVATVDQSGKVRGVGVGSATITSVAGDCSATCVVIVSIPVEDIILDHTSVNLKQGRTVQLTATIVPAVAIDKTITWSSSDERVATVDQQGVVTAVTGGQARIIATAGSCTAVCTVRVVPLATSIALSQSDAVLITGQSLTLTANILPVEASGTEISWSSSNANLCSVANGVVTEGNSTGRATITASVDGVSATCSILVVRDSYTGVYASYNGGSIISINDVIQSGSQLNYSVTNYSSETIRVVSVQLIDGVTGSQGNVMSLGKDIVLGDFSGWTVTIGAAGIRSPIARFVYTFRGTQYTCEAQYWSFSF